jgi:hypothetical protein
MEELRQSAGTAWPIPQYYRISEVAQRLAVSEKTIIRRIKDDPDVRVITDSKRGVRKYRTYLLPDATLRRLVDSLKPHV